MTKRYIAITMALVMGASLIGGCNSSSGNSSESTTAVVSQQTNEAEDNAIYGEVKSVSEDSITIAVGTRKERPDKNQMPGQSPSGDQGETQNGGQSQDQSQGEAQDQTQTQAQDQAQTPGDNQAQDQAQNQNDSQAQNQTQNQDGSQDQNQTQNQDGSQAQNQTPNQSDVQNQGQTPDMNRPSFLDLTGEEKNISITSDTVVEKISMGFPGGQPPTMSDGQTPPDFSNGQTPPDLPDGQTPPDLPDGQTPPDLPDGQTPSAMPDGQQSQSDSDSQNAQSGTDNQQSQSGTDGQQSQSDSDNQNAQSGTDNQQSQSGTDDQQSQSGSDSQNSQGQKPGMPQMETEEIALSDIQEGDVVAITLDDSGNAAKITLMSMGQGGPGGNGGPGGSGAPGGGSQSAPETYEAVNTYSKDTDVSGESISSTGTDENAVHVTDGAKVTISDSNINRKSSDSQGGDTSSFYGVGAAILTTDGTTYVKDSNINTDAGGAAGVFSYGDGTSYVSGATINTKEGTSGGIHVAGGGTLYAWDSTVETNGQSSAAIRSDRGGGTMVVDGGSYTSNGVGSPAIYSTADISVNNAVLTANGSEAICIEGDNSIRLFNSELTGNMSDDEQNDTTWNVILYQSMSGDSEEGNSTFEMDGGSLTAKNGGMFYTTNTESTFTLKNVDITNADDAEFLLRCTGNQNQRGWGTSGKNGADCIFTAIEQKLSGDILWDTISELDFYLTDKSSLTGAIKDDESNAGNGGDGYCKLYIDEGSTWTVTGDSTLTGLYSEGKIVDESGKTVTVKGTDGTEYVKGDSKYTITVNEYKDSADTSGASSISTWDKYQVEKPE